MKLSEFKGILPLPDDRSGAIAVSSIASDSRKDEPGSLFFAVRWTKADGALFAGDAARRGAAAVDAASGAVRGDIDVPVIEVAEPRGALALAAALLFDGQPESMVAVTGTSGKASVASLTGQILEREGHRSASIGTTGVVAPGRSEYGSLTTTDPVELHRLLRELKDAQVTHAAMEASSHGLDQHRLDGVKLAAGAFTNLGRDHL